MNDRVIREPVINQKHIFRMIKEPVSIKCLYNFDKLRDLVAGNDDFILSLVLIFLKTTPVDSAEMLKASQTGDWQKVSKLAHKIKSTVNGMSISSIKNDILTLEMDAKNKTNIAALPQLALMVDKVINEVVLQVKEEFNLHAAILS